MKYDLENIFDKAITFSWSNRTTGILESFRKKQIESKKYIVHVLGNYSGKKEFSNIAVLGSWNSILLYELMEDNFKIGKWDFIDKDNFSHFVRRKYFEYYDMPINWGAYETDAVELISTDQVEKYDLIINPSCEHMQDIKAEPGRLYLLTSSNKKIPEHINTVENETDLAVKNGIDNILYKGSLSLGEDEKRFCVLGSKNE